MTRSTHIALTAVPGRAAGRQADSASKGRRVAPGRVDGEGDGEAGDTPELDGGTRKT